MSEKSHYFEHEKLDVYQAALKFVILTDEIVENLPRGRAYLADQLQRASTSILLTISEGAILPHGKKIGHRMRRNLGCYPKSWINKNGTPTAGARSAAPSGINAL